MLQNTVVAPGSVGNVIWPPFDEGANVSGPSPAVIRRPGDCGDDQLHQHVTAVHLEHPCSLLLPSNAARNLHLVPPGQLDASINRHASIQKQLRTFSSSFQDAYVPHDVLLPLLLEDLSDTSIRASRALAGNCAAGCTVISRNQEQHLAFSNCGQIGEQLLLTVVQPDKGANTGSYELQTVTTAQINLGKEILQIDVQPYSSQNPQLRQLPTEIAADIVNRNGQSAGVWVLARSMYRVDVLWAGCKHHANSPVIGRTGGRALADNISSRDWQLEWRGSVHLPCPAAHVKLHPTLPECLVLMDDGNVGLVSLAPCSGIQSSQLAAPIPLNCSLLFSPEVLSRTKTSSGMQAGSTLQDSQVTMTCTWGIQPRTILLALQGSLWRCGVRTDTQGLPCSQPTLLNQLPGSDVYLSIARLQQSRHGFAIASHSYSNGRTAAALQQQENPISQQQPAAVPATSTRNNAVQEDDTYQRQHIQHGFIAQTLLPYMAALTSTQVMLIDLRRPQGHVIATPHACTSYPPMYLNVQALQQVVSTPQTQHQQLSKALHAQGGAQGVQAVVASSSLQHNTCSQQADVRLNHPLQQHAPWPVQDTGQALDGESEQQASSVDVLLTWGTSQGAVYSWQLAVRPSSVQLALGQQANTMAVSNTPSLADTVASQLLVCHAGRSLGQEQRNAAHHTTTLAASHSIAGLSSQLLLASWQPACFEVVQAVGLVRQLCKPNSLKNDARLQRLHKQRADIYSQDETSHSDDGLESSHSAVNAFEARYWGHQSDVLSRRAELIKSHLQASEHVPDLQGLAVFPPWHTQATQATPAALLLRSSFDGDLAVQQLHCDMSTTAQSAVKPWMPSTATSRSPAALPPHVTTRQGMKAIDSKAAAAPLQTKELTGIKPPITESAVSGLSSQLARRYTSASHAARMLLGPQQGILKPSSPRLRVHYHSFIQLLQAIYSSQALPVGGSVGHMPQQQHSARDDGRGAGATLGQQQRNGDSHADPVTRHDWQLEPRQPVQSVMRVSSIAAKGIQEGVGSSRLSHLLNHDSVWQKAVRDMVLNTGSTLTIGDVMLRLSRAVGKEQTAVTEKESSHVAKLRKTQPKHHAAHSLLVPGPYDQTVAVKQGSQKGYVEQILQNTVQTAANSLSLVQSQKQPAEKTSNGKNLDNLAGNGEPSQIDKARSSIQPSYGVLACCKTASDLLADAQALQDCLQAGIAGTGVTTGQESVARIEHEPYRFLQSAITVRSQFPREDSGKHIATGTARNAPDHGKQQHGNVEKQPIHHSSDLTKAVLALHGTIILRDQVLRPTTSRIARADTSSSPVEQRQAQFNKQFTGMWRIGMPQEALDTYHHLLDAWPEEPCATVREKTQPPSTQDSASRDARFFVPGHQRDAAPSTPPRGVNVGGKTHDNMPAGAGSVRDGVGRSVELRSPKQAAPRPAQQVGEGVARQGQIPATQTHVSSQPSSVIPMQASAQLPIAHNTGSAPSQSGGVLPDIQASQPQSQSQARPQLLAAARAALLERKRKAASRAAEGF